MGGGEGNMIKRNNPRVGRLSVAPHAGPLPRGVGGLSADGLEGGVAEVSGRLTAKAPEDWAHSGTLRAAGGSVDEGAVGAAGRA